MFPYETPNYLRQHPASHLWSHTALLHSLTCISFSVCLCIHCWYSHSSQTMNIVHLDCCRSFLTGVRDFLLTRLPCLFHMEDKRESIDQIMSLFCIQPSSSFPLRLEGKIQFLFVNSWLWIFQPLSICPMSFCVCKTCHVQRRARCSSLRHRTWRGERDRKSTRLNSSH